MVDTQRIVITGAPGTGKTALIKALEQQGLYCYHEIIRAMTAKAKDQSANKEQRSNPLAFVDDPLTFNKTLLEGRAAHFDNSLERQEGICFFDRGIPDVLAYMDYFKQDYPADFETVINQRKYDKIFILPPWKEIYVSDNERLESFEEAEALHEHLEATYKRFGYQVHVVPKVSIAERALFVMDALD